MIEDVADAFTHYVVVCGVPEETFWECDTLFVHEVSRDKAAYDGWVASEHERELEEARNGR